MPKAKQDPDCMAGRDFEGENDTRKAEKARPPAAKQEGINGSTVGGKTRRAQKKQKMKQHGSRTCAKSDAKSRLHGRT